MRSLSRYRWPFRQIQSGGSRGGSPARAAGAAIPGPGPRCGDRSRRTATLPPSSPIRAESSGWENATGRPARQSRHQRSAPPAASSSTYNIGGVAAIDPAGVDDERGVTADQVVIDIGVSSDNNHRVLGLQGRALESHADHPGESREVAHRGRAGNQRVMVGDFGSEAGEELENNEPRALSHIIDVAFVCHTEKENAGAVYRLAARIEGAAETFDDVLRHARVDLAGELDKLRREAILAGLPGEVEGVNGDAM